MSLNFICRNDIVEIKMPVEADVIDIIALRNNPETIKWFFDRTPVNANDTRKWLFETLIYPYDVMLTIKSRSNNLFLGTIGWKFVNVEQGIVDFGRFMTHKNNVKLLLSSNSSLVNRKIGLEVAKMIKEFAFNHLRINKAITTYIKNNRAAEFINLGIGMQIVKENSILCKSGEIINVVELELSRETWLKNKEN